MHLPTAAVIGLGLMLLLVGGFVFARWGHRRGERGTESGPSPGTTRQQPNALAGGLVLSRGGTPLSLAEYRICTNGDQSRLIAIYVTITNQSELLLNGLLYGPMLEYEHRDMQKMQEQFRSGLNRVVFITNELLAEELNTSQRPGARYWTVWPGKTKTFSFHYEPKGVETCIQTLDTDPLDCRGFFGTILSRILADATATPSAVYGPTGYAKMSVLMESTGSNNRFTLNQFRPIRAPECQEPAVESAGHATKPSATASTTPGEPATAVAQGGEGAAPVPPTVPAVVGKANPANVPCGSPEWLQFSQAVQSYCAATKAWGCSMVGPAFRACNAEGGTDLAGIPKRNLSRQVFDYSFWAEDAGFITTFEKRDGKWRAIKIRVEGAEE
jgi:hypothetical protein